MCLCTGDEPTGDCSLLCLLIVAFFLPPLAVGCRLGCNIDLCINILLTLLGWLPGVIHAYYVILKNAHPEARSESPQV